MYGIDGHKMSDSLLLGIDVGSTTVKVVILLDNGAFLAGRYVRAHGRPRQTLLQAAESVAAELGMSLETLETRLSAVGITGSGGRPVSEIIGGFHVNELVAQTRAVGESYPQARTVIELGGQDSKFLSVRWDPELGKMVLDDMAMNSICAAGTGAFLDQQAARLGISIENDFAAIALQSETPARIAGRCTVFAKSDMIHLQQQGTPLPDILAGLALALARNFKGVIGRGKPFTPPVVFQGGVAYNQAVARAFEDVLKLQPGELIIPHYPQFMAAIGCALIAFDEVRAGRAVPFRGLAPLQSWLHQSEYVRHQLEPLSAAAAATATMRVTESAHDLAGSFCGDGTSPRVPAYLGIDVGSITTKAVIIDDQGNVLARRYLLTKGRPLEAVRFALAEVGREMAEHVTILAVGTTGSGRYLTSEFVGGDVVRSEITAQARAAVAIDPSVDTVFEIGGQDSKFIRLEKGAITNFAMNSACAAGTGSFLEEQATRLELRIEDEFSRRAFCAACPVGLGERCTVFMESDLVHHQQQGTGTDDLAAGLAYAIVENYLNRVVGTRPIGDHIFFQGGVAHNQSVVAAFRARTGKRVTVPPHHDVSGAIGAALLARDERLDHQGAYDARALITRFRGFDLSTRTYESKSFICQACPNLCEINRVTVADEPPIFYGARCDMYENAQRDQRLEAAHLPDLFAERLALLMGDYQPHPRRAGRPRVGLPRVLHFYDLFPYWRAFFDELGMDIVLSDTTNALLARRAREHATSDVCYPIKLVYGHMDELREQDLDYLFYPAIMNRENPAPGQKENTYCPYIRTAGFLAAATMDLAAGGAKPVLTSLHMQWPAYLHDDLAMLARDFGVSARAVEHAHEAGMAVLDRFHTAMRRRGQEILTEVAPNAPAVVLVGRPYNTADPGVSLDLPYKLRKLNTLPIPIDFLPLDQANVTARYSNMFWHCGQQILAAGELIRHDPRLYAIYVTNFSCGPDSFIISMFRRMMAGKPHLELEIDEHAADAGLITRCQAFVESLQARRRLEQLHTTETLSRLSCQEPL
jgi:predicted CoA-substrate-specific enzyme activase